jgi:oligosaccharyltransferase complex subunit beta
MRPARRRGGGGGAEEGGGSGNRGRCLLLAPSALLLACLLLPSPALAQPRGPRLLVLFDDATVGKRTHSQLLEGLWRAGYEADVRSAGDPRLALRDDVAGWRYDHLLLLAPATAASLGGDKDARIRAAKEDARRSGSSADTAATAALATPAPSLQDVAAFVEQGAGNVMVAVSPDSPDALRSLALDLGVEMDDRGSRVYDHFSRPVGGGAFGAEEEDAAEANGEGPAVLARGVPSDRAAAAAFFGGEEELRGQPVLYRGGAAVVPHSSAGTAAVVLSASPAAYTHKPGAASGVVAADPSAASSSPDPAACPTGAAAALAVAVTARNNARVAVVGSLFALSDAAFAAKGFRDASTGEAVTRTANADFALGLARWAFADRAVLVLDNARHRILPDSASSSTGSEDGGVNARDRPEVLRINDEVEFLVDVWEVEGSGAGKAKSSERRTPYVPPADAPLQLSFTMLDPHVRLPLAPLDPAKPNGTLSLRFRVPDVYGVFKFTVDHRRLGFSRLDLSTEAPVRPYRHDEYERFLLPAYPYYASALSTTVALFLVVVVVLYSKDQ